MDTEHLAHLEWLGYVQPVGLVVSIPALLAAQAHINRYITPEHQRFLACLPQDRYDNIIPEIRDLAAFTQTVLGWEPTDLTPIPDVATLPEDLAALEVALPEYHETLRPAYGVREFSPPAGQAPWLMLIQCLPIGTDLDAPMAASERHWHASPQAKCERLLRETGVPIGLLVNGTHLRLVYAPRGETSGYITFSIAEMAQVAGRPIFAGLHLLLSAERLFSLPEPQRLPALLAESRKYQNTVSTQLAEQVLAALYELLRGFQAADDQRHGALLHEALTANPNHVYAGLLTVLMRLVFILYAEDRGLLPSDPVYTNYYAVTGLFERLREDVGRHPDTMDLRYGAWAQLLTLFRLVYEGGRHGAMRLPARQGYLFDPDRYAFLEGRQRQWLVGRQWLVDSGQWLVKNSSPSSSPLITNHQPLTTSPTTSPSLTTNHQPLTTSPTTLPYISDGVIFRVLNNLLILDGERLSYRTLDVEQIGSVYETMMGFNLEVAQGQSIAIKPTKAHGAPTTINLEELLVTRAPERLKWLADQTDQKLTGQVADALKSATSIDDLLAALDRRIAKNVTPHMVPAGSMVLQPSDERRRSGSHYTPRSLTEPIVRTTLRPILARLGDTPTPEQILDLKVCDPAMGSGAFLVEACRLLGDELVKAWHVHDSVLVIPPDEDEVLHARRLVAQQCLYGVDKNPMAVDLAKLSLWLATLAKDHPFTFLDHSLRCGDSLVGLTKEQIAAFHWTRTPALTTNHQPLTTLFKDPIAERMQRAMAYRQRILAARDAKPYEQLRQELGVADDALSLVKLAGDLVIAAFFSATKDRDRVERLNALARQLVQYTSRQGRIEDGLPLTEAADALRGGERPIEPFHWEIEFPEVFGRENGGFDAIVGNPPFLGGMLISTSISDSYKTWLYDAFPESGNRMDLVAYFFRKAFALIRFGGTFGFVATNTISQGDTREGGLRYICQKEGTIFHARRRLRWPGEAAVVISVVHVAKGVVNGLFDLNDQPVSRITAYLFHSGGNESPELLEANRNRCFIGCNVLGMGFTFDNTDAKGVASPLSEMERLLRKDPRNRERIFPFIGGEEVNTSPTHSNHRFVISFGDMSEEEARRWPDLMHIVEERVKPDRDGKPGSYSREWWLFGRRNQAGQLAIESLDRVLVNSQVSSHLGFAFLPSDWIFAHTLNVYAFDSFSSFCALQARVHEIWARFFASSMKDDMRYTPSDCFETFPFPENFETNACLEAIGKEYYEFRAQLMIANNEGLTKIYNRFHDPNERSPEIKKLRELHDAMDRAVLDAYGWTDLVPTCEFLLDYEEDEDDEDSSSRRRKPWRYRWPDDVRDEVLARLLELNKQRAEQERLAGLTAEAATGMSQGRKKLSSTATSRRKQSAPNTAQPDLLGR